jgi:hypothetical protein
MIWSPAANFRAPVYRLFDGWDVRPDYFRTRLEQRV